MKHPMVRIVNSIAIATIILSCGCVAQPPTVSAKVNNTNIILEQGINQCAFVAVITIEEPIIEKESQEKEKNKYLKGWTTTDVNVRKKPGLKSNILEVYPYNTKIKYIDYNDEWVQIKYNDDIAYMYKEYISDTKMPEIDYTLYNVPDNSGFKSWMPYTAITSKSSPQYKLQYNYAYTGNYGIRMVDDRYCVAIGSHFNCAIGQKFDLILENGTIIKCIMGDLKANQHTDSSNIFSANGCCSEFLIDKSAIYSKIKNSGNASSACDEWNSKVVQIKVYDDNIFN